MLAPASRRKERSRTCSLSTRSSSPGKTAFTVGTFLFFHLAFAFGQKFEPIASQACVDEAVKSGWASGGRKGDVRLKILLPFHSTFDYKARVCGGFNPATAVRDVEAVRLAFELVDKSRLLGNLSLGYEIKDTCNNVHQVIEVIKELKHLEGNCGKKDVCKPFEITEKLADDFCRKTAADEGNINAIVGIADSAVVEAITDYMLSSETILISHMASSQRLASGENFFRVIPEDGFEVKGLAAVLEHFRWTHIAAFSCLTDHCMAMFSALRKNFSGMEENRSPLHCLAIQEKFSKENTDTMETVAKQLAAVPHINVVLMFGGISETVRFIEIVKEIEHVRLMDRLVWLFSSKWGREFQELPRGHPSFALLRLIKYGLFLEPVPTSTHPWVGLKWDRIADMLRERLQNLSSIPQDDSFNPWFKKAWSTTGECAPSFYGVQETGSGENPQNPKRSLCGLQGSLGSSLFLIDACFHAAQAIFDVLVKNNHTHRSCRSSRWYHGQYLNSVALDNLQLSRILDKCLKTELENQPVTGHELEKVLYQIKLIQPRLQQSDELVKTITLGHWSPRSDIIFNSKAQNIVRKLRKDVKSECPRRCSAGEKVALDYVAYARPCCWKRCYPCKWRTFSYRSDSKVCEECDRGQRPNDNHTACHLYMFTQTSDSVSAYAVAVFAVTGSFLALLTMILFQKNRNMFIVKTADFTLSMVMLSFHILSFLSVALLLAEPSKDICTAQVLLVLVWPVLYIGCILVKTNRLRVLFCRTRKLTQRRLLLLSNKTQVLFVTVVGLITVILLITWVVVSRPYRDILYSEDSVDYTCHRSKAWMGVYFSGALSLLLTSLWLSFQARNLPADFNEASYLLLSTLSVTFLWIILVPAYYGSTSIKPDTLLALIITCQGNITLVCLFARRLYYIIRPRSEEKMRSVRMLSRSPSKTRMTVVGKASSVSRGSDYNHASIAETQFGVTRTSESSEKISPAVQQSTKDVVAVCNTYEAQL